VLSTRCACKVEKLDSSFEDEIYFEFLEYLKEGDLQFDYEIFVELKSLYN
jgi:hypothetical protein